MSAARKPASHFEQSTPGSRHSRASRHAAPPRPPLQTPRVMHRQPNPSRSLGRELGALSDLARAHHTQRRAARRSPALAERCIATTHRHRARSARPLACRQPRAGNKTLLPSSQRPTRPAQSPCLAFGDHPPHGGLARKSARCAQPGRPRSTHTPACSKLGRRKAVEAVAKASVR